MSAGPRAQVLGIVSKVGKRFSKKRVLVTGGAGFLGSWLCDALVACGSTVDCLDNFSSGRIENLSDTAVHRVIRGNVTSVRLDADYDFIFHMSSRASPEEYQQYPMDTLLANSLGTRRVLELANASKAVLVYASTSEVYGDAEVIPTPESYPGLVSSVGVRSCYDEGKRFGEALCMAYFRQYGTKVRIARIFNTYGSRMRSDGIYARVVPRFISQARAGAPVTVHGTGLQTRSFCYVTDTVTAMALLSLAAKINGQVVNIGNPQEVSIKSLAEKIIRVCGSKSPVSFAPGRDDDPQRRCPDISKAKKLLGWAPIVGLDKGLRLVLESQK